MRKHQEHHNSIAVKFWKWESGRFAATSVSRAEGPRRKQKAGGLGAA